MLQNAAEKLRCVIVDEAARRNARPQHAGIVGKKQTGTRLAALSNDYTHRWRVNVRKDDISLIKTSRFALRLPLEDLPVPVTIVSRIKRDARNIPLLFFR